MQPERAVPKPFTTHKSTCKDRTDEEWRRDGVKQMNRSQDMAVRVFGGWLTHKNSADVLIVVSCGEMAA